MLVYRKDNRYIFTIHIQAGSEWISRTYPRLLRREVMGPRRTATPDRLSCSTCTRTQRGLTLINMPRYFLPQMGRRRICVRKVKFTHTVYLKIGTSSTHARKHVRQRAHKRTYWNIRYGNKTNVRYITV